MILKKNEYQTALDKIVVSDELKEKIIHQCSSAPKSKKPKLYKQFYRAAGLAACFAVFALSYYAYDHQPLPGTSDISVTPIPNQVQDAFKEPDTEYQPPAASEAVQTPKPEKAVPKKDEPKREPERTQPPKATAGEASAPTGEVKTDENVMAEKPDQNEPLPSDGDSGELAETAPPALTTPPPEEAPNGIMSSAGGAVGEVLSVAELEHELGYPIKAPQNPPDGYRISGMSVLFGEMAEILYTSEDDMIYYRTAKASGDISGDYNLYSDQETILAGEREITIKGNDGKYHNASWNEGEEAFSIYSTAGLERDVLISLAEHVS